MSLEQHSVLPIIMGDTFLQAKNKNRDASHLYISFSDLIINGLTHYPFTSQHIDTLNNTEKMMTKEGDIDQHIVQILTEQVVAAIQPNHKSIRLCLNDADSETYKALIGDHLEQDECNPLIGARGVALYTLNHASNTFIYECEMIKKLRARGIDVEIVVPFVRTLSDAATIIDRLAEQQLPRGLNGLKVLYSCDVPSSALLAERLLHYFDGMVINVDNLTQLTLGVDKSNEAVQHLFNPENISVINMIDYAVKTANTVKKPVLMVTHQLANYPKLQEYILEMTPIDVVNMD